MGERKVIEGLCSVCVSPSPATRCFYARMFCTVREEKGEGIEEGGEEQDDRRKR